MTFVNVAVPPLACTVWRSVVPEKSWTSAPLGAPVLILTSCWKPSEQLLAFLSSEAKNVAWSTGTVNVTE